MRPANALSTRREFLQASAAATVSAAVPASNALDQHAPQQLRGDAFLARQKERRKQLWKLLGDLPWEHNPGPAKLVSKEEKEDYMLERLVFDLNGVGHGSLRAAWMFRARGVLPLLPRAAILTTKLLSLLFIILRCFQQYSTGPAL